MGRRNHFIQLVKVLYCKLPTISNQLTTFPHKVQGLNHRPQRCEASVLPLHQLGPLSASVKHIMDTSYIFMHIEVLIRVMYYLRLKVHCEDVLSKSK